MNHKGFEFIKLFYLILKFLGLLLCLECDESVSLGAAAPVGDDLGGPDVPEGREQLVEVGLGRRAGDPTHEDAIGDQGAVLDAGATAAGTWGTDEQKRRRGGH